MGNPPNPSQSEYDEQYCTKTPAVMFIAKFVISLGHLALWPTLYALGIAIVLSEFLQIPITTQALIYIALCSHAGYLLDRIKFRSADLDPADLSAQPPRHTFLRNHARFLRKLMFAEWIAAAILGSFISPLLGILVLAGIAAGYLYSGWKPGSKASRLKDIPGLKAAMVSTAIVGLALAVLLTTHHKFDHSAISWTTVLALWLIVCGDAIICDMDDQTTDKAYKTQSLPVLLGNRRAGFLATALLLTGGLLLIQQHQNPTRLVFAATTLISGIGIIRQHNRRDWIDARLLPLALIAIWFG